MTNEYQPDDVVGRIQTDSIHGSYGGQLTEDEVWESVRFSDLDPEVQERLRNHDDAARKAGIYHEQLVAAEERIAQLEDKRDEAKDTVSEMLWWVKESIESGKGKDSWAAVAIGEKFLASIDKEEST